MTRHKHADVIHAFAEGAEVQFRRAAGERWEDERNPSFFASNEYRIKPRIVKCEAWVVIGKNPLGERRVRTNLFRTLSGAISVFPAETPCKIEWEETE